MKITGNGSGIRLVEAVDGSTPFTLTSFSTAPVAQLDRASDF